jgi:hypothetical protein
MRDDCIKATGRSRASIDAVVDAMRWFDARPSAQGGEGEIRLSEIVPHLLGNSPAGSTSSSVVSGNNAVVLLHNDGQVSNTVVLGQQFFFLGGVENLAQANEKALAQKVTLVHETLHVLFRQQNHEALRAAIGAPVGRNASDSDAINSWIRDCLK